MDHDPSSEPLAQAKATRRRIRRLRAAERRLGQHEHAAEADAERRANTLPPPATRPADQHVDAATLLHVEQDLIAFERASLITDRDLEDVDDSVDL